MTRLVLLWLVAALALITSACGDPASKERTGPDLPDVKANLAFTCAYEKDNIPPRDAEADQLYIHARWVKKNNLLKEDPLVFPKIERLIRISTAYGHDKANLELRQMIGKGTAGSEDIVKETLDLADDLIKRGIPGGFYDMGRYLEQGYGVKQDEDLALKSYRKSADMGSPEGQYAVGDRLTGAGDESVRNIGIQMWRCAVEQGHGKAGEALGIRFANLDRYPEALQAYQLGAKAGEDGAASFLRHGFDGPVADDRLYYLGQQKDEERYQRYKAIWSFLADYSYLNPKIPEIDEIVPLPPAKLPAWDGSFKWLKEHEANVPPPLPSEERIREMAKAKNLDTENGRPLKHLKKAEAQPTKPLAAAPVIPLGTAVPSGTRCLQSGLWQCSASNALGGERRHFTVGETLPTVLVAVERSLFHKRKGAPANQLAETTWTLVEWQKSTKDA